MSGKAPPDRAEPSAANLQASLSARDSYGADDPVEVKLTVSNPGRAHQNFCRYHTPFEGIQNDIFALTGPSGTLPYTGIMRKRAPAGPDDEVTLAPAGGGEGLGWAFKQCEATVDLRDGYGKLPPGEYTLQFKGGDVSRLPASETISFVIQS